MSMSEVACICYVCSYLTSKHLVKIFSNLKLVTGKLPYSGKLLREKTFVNFAVLWQSTKVFSAKIVFFTNLRKFSLSKVSRYTVASCNLAPHLRWLHYIDIFSSLTEETQKISSQLSTLRKLVYGMHAPVMVVHSPSRIHAHPHTHSPLPSAHMHLHTLTAGGASGGRWEGVGGEGEGEGPCHYAHVQGSRGSRSDAHSHLRHLRDLRDS